MPTRSRFLLSLAVLLAACAPAPDNGNGTPLRPVQTVAPETAPAAPPVRAVGRLVLREEQNLSFRVPGIVRELPVRAGDSVRAGQVLARLDSTEVDAAVAQARAALDKAERDRARGERLRVEEVITQQQYDDLVTTAQVAHAQYEAAEFNHRFSVIRAPADGVVLRRFVERNEMVQAGQPVVAVGSDDNGFVVTASLPDRQAVRVALGDAARIRLDAFPQREFHGEVREISRSADPRTGTFDIEIALLESAGRLASGLVARAEIDAHNGAGSLHPSVPLTALVQGGSDMVQIFLLDDSDEPPRARMVQTRVLWFDDHRAVLEGGVAPDARVITGGAGFLRDGEAVRLAE